MAREYPYYAGISRKLKGPSSNPCVVCGKPATRYADVQMSWFRGDDEEIALCDEKACRQAARQDIDRYMV